MHNKIPTFKIQPIKKWEGRKLFIDKKFYLEIDESNRIITGNIKTKPFKDFDSAVAYAESIIS